MATKTEICNLALSQIGAVFITNIDEDSKEARTCKALFDNLRDQLLEMADWNFATKRVQLAQDSDTPVYDYDYQYELPADMIRLSSVKDDPDYLIEGGMLLTDMEEIYIRYIFKQTDVSKFTAAFARCMSLLLAAELAVRIADDMGKKQAILQELYNIALPNAAKLDGWNNPTEESAQDWETAGR